MAGGALSGLRVLECGDFVAAPFAASLFGHLGADVVKVEPPEGDSNRRRGPYPGGKSNPESGGLHLYLDQAKRGAVLDLDDAGGWAEFRRLAAAADVVIASGEASKLRRRGLTYDALKEVNPALVVTSVTPFGLEDSRSDLPMRELCDLAAAGWLSMSPGALDDPSLPPLKPFGQQAHYQAGIHAGVSTLGAIAARERFGVGQQVDVSVQAAIASQVESGLVHYTYGGRVASRLGTRIVGPWGMVQLADGLMFLVCVTEDDWKRLLEYIGNPEWADSPLFADRLLRAENNDGLLPLIESELAGHDVMKTYSEMQERRIPCAPISEMADLLDHPHLEHRDHFQDVDHPVAGKWTYPGAPWNFSKTPWQVVSRAPLLGEHTDEVKRDWTKPRIASPVVAPPDAGTGERLPLDGVRVIAFTWVWAGPMCGLQLAHLGADVIRVESSLRMDTLRAGAPPFWGGQSGPNRSGYVNQYSQGKRSVTLNLKNPDAVEIAYDLIRHADVVVDNFGAGAMERMGFGYEKLRAIKPDIVQISMAGHGQTGPIANFVAYGPTQVPMIGLASLTGYPGGGPREVGISYGDPNGGMQAAFAVLAALYHKRHTGEGQYIDMSQWEAAIPLVNEGLLTYQMTGKQPARMGGRDEFQAPQGVFRCLGPGGPSGEAQRRASQTSEDDWLAVSCWTDDEWQALARCIGRPDLAKDAGLASAAGRKEREEELEAAISAWTAQKQREEAAAALQAAGVPAQWVHTTKDVVEDPGLAARNFWVELPHCECSGARHAGIPWLLSGTPLRVRRAAPCLGEHTDEVLREVLGKTDAEIEELRSGGALQ